MWELRIPGADRWRAWGHVDLSVFYSVWWDPDQDASAGRVSENGDGGTSGSSLGPQTGWSMPALPATGAPK